jgi:hypothetical protein
MSEPLTVRTSHELAAALLASPDAPITQRATYWDDEDGWIVRYDDRYEPATVGIYTPQTYGWFWDEDDDE